MNDKAPKSETKCTACGKEWYHAETFIIVSVNCKGYVEDGNYVDDDALFGERELAALCEECASKTESFNAEIRYDDIREHTAESYMAEIHEASKYFP
jgi:hypothetical protein